MDRLDTFLSTKFACELESNLCPYAVPEEGKRQIKIGIKSFRYSINKRGKPCKWGFGNPVFTPWELNSADLYAFRHIL